MTYTRRVLTVAQTAKLLGVSQQMVRWSIAHKRLTATKMGRDWILSEVAVERFAALPRKRGKPFADPSAIKASSRTRRKYRERARLSA